ncbi:hypothetical protein C8E95_6752 [Pseudonocardia autotrophica]|uniref:Uncharacterized protein n=2 Tax=Pseudonocardia TaxID=1847 RepID=A0A1Y2N7P4_PSEAH|nr:hypothetical protein BG845_01170 [Pseudonocardia autotrophica]TDN77504.1 hypothetical protein C8E95_6752 [Pseudonocardia autotrophica]
MSSRRIADELDISQATAVRMLREAEAAEGFIDLLDKAEARVAQALRLNEYMTWLRRRIEEGAKAEVVIPVAMQVENRWAKLHGLDAPSRVAVSDDRPEKGMDPAVLAAVREAQQRNVRERHELGAPASEGES